MAKDWTGNKSTTWKTLGASNHCPNDRAERDFYATDPRAIDALFGVEEFAHKILEPACGNGHLVKRMIELEKEVYPADIVVRDYPCVEMSFFDYTKPLPPYFDIVTNPPYKYAKEFVEHAMEILAPGSKLALFLKLTFLEGQDRRKLFDKYPPARIHVFSKRINCAINGDEKEFAKSSAACYAWFVWEKGNTKLPIIDWI